MRSKVLPLTVTALLVAACGGAPSAHRPVVGQPGAPTSGASSHNSAASQSQDALAAPSGAAGSGETTAQPSPLNTGTAPGTTATGPSAHPITTASPRPLSSHSPSPSQPPGGGGCPDPRYCADYYLDQGDPSWPKDGSGVAVIHYRINPSHSGTPTQLSDSQIIAVVQQMAHVWMAADPSLDFVYDGQTSDQPVSNNNVVGFSAAAANGAANISLAASADGKTITGFDIALAPQVTWEWDSCDGASTACSPYPGPGSALDVGAILAHSWGHVLGLGDLAATQDEYLTDFGGIAGSYPDCGGNASGMICRFAATLGLGDILGARYLYPTSAPMPTIYYDS